MFQLLLTFASVYKTRNFTHTADELFLSQPTVSMQIKKLEENLGVELFERSGKQDVVPTDEAQFLYPRILQILDEWQDASTRVKERENYRDRCSIACSHTCAIYYVPKLMPKLIEKFPTVDFSLSMMNSDEAVLQMEQNTIDLSFVEIAKGSPHLEQTPLYQDELVLAGDPESPYWLLREPESGLRFYNETYLDHYNLNRHIIQINNNETLLALLREGVGTAIVSKLSIDERIRWQPLPENNQRQFYLLAHKNAFRQKLHEIAASIIELADDFPTILN